MCILLIQGNMRVVMKKWMKRTSFDYTLWNTILTLPNKSQTLTQTDKKFNAKLIIGFVYYDKLNIIKCKKPLSRLLFKQSHALINRKICTHCCCLVQKSFYSRAVWWSHISTKILPSFSSPKWYMILDDFLTRHP